MKSVDSTILVLTMLTFQPQDDAMPLHIGVWKNRVDRIRQRDAAWTKVARIPDHDRLIEVAGQLVFEPEEYEDLNWALSVFDRVRQILKEDGAPPESHSCCRRAQASHLAARGQEIKAISTLREALALGIQDDERYEVLFSLGEILSEAGESTEALDFYRQAAHLEGASPQSRMSAYYQAAHLHIQKKQTTQVEAVIEELQRYLEAPLSPQDLCFGWGRIASLRQSLGESDVALEAQRQAVATQSGKDLEESAYEPLLQLYRLAAPLAPDGRSKVSVELLERAKAAGGERAQLTVLIHLAQIDLQAGRATEARKKVANIGPLINRLQRTITKQQMGHWRLELSLLERGLSTAQEGESVHTRRYVVALDEEGVPVLDQSKPTGTGPPQFSVDSPRAMASQTSLAELEAARAKLLSQDQEGLTPEETAATQRFLESIVSGIELPSQPTDSLTDHIKRLEAQPDFDHQQGWIVLQRALQEGQQDWVASYLGRQVKHEAERGPQFFDLKSMLETLLEALEKSGRWDDGWRWLDWWRDVIAETDHSESRHIDDVLLAQINWAKRTKDHVRHRQYMIERLSFNERIHGPNSPGAQDARADLNRVFDRKPGQ